MGPNRSRAVVLVGGLALVVLAGCVSTIEQSGSNSAPSASGSLGFAEESESEEPSVPAQPPAGGEMAGTWDGTWAVDGYGTTGDFTMELVQSGDDFSGTVESTDTGCPTGTVEGTLDGSSVSFSWVLSGVPVSFAGTKDGASMTGTWSAVSCDNAISITGVWEATKRP
jgi:hypothetical protein